jgi:hypothetical protein
MTDTMTFQNIDLSSWDTLYNEDQQQQQESQELHDFQNRE